MARVRDVILVVIGAVLWTLPYHFPSTAPGAFVAFVPILKALENKSGSAALRYGYLAGAIHFALVGWWLHFVNTFGYVLLSAYLGLYMALWAHAAVSILGLGEPGSSPIIKGVRSVFYAAAAWTFLEYVRGWFLTGLPWGLLGYSQWKNTPFIQIADVVGAFGVSFAVIAVNLLVYRLLSTFRLVRRGGSLLAADRDARVGALRRHALSLGILVIAVLGYGAGSLASRDAFYDGPAPKAVLRVSVVQGNIPQDQKWDSKIKEIIFEKYRRLTLLAAAEKPDLIVWPETSFPGYLEDEPILSAKLRSLVRQSQTGVLVGAPTMGDFDKNLRFYNSAVWFGADGEEKARSHKLHLVPFGEYIPYEPLLGFLRNFVQIGHFNSGAGPVLFHVRSRYQKIPIEARFASLVCFEDIFPELVRGFVGRGANFLVNMTNDAWFGKTAAPYQHAQASVFRAVENRVPVIRSANTGLSCFISAEGRILSSVSENGEEIEVTGVQTQNLILRRGTSFYTRAGGPLFFWLVVLLLVLAWRESSRRQAYFKI